ncbi:MAG TPA: type II secretion system protein GspM [Gallionella sp.]|nr:type II secretion system protein GspM [Gallionella sp.]
MKRYWDRASAAIDELSLRERTMIFVAAAFVVISLINVLLIDPLLARQKLLSSQVAQRQEKMKELQAQMQNILQAKKDSEHSPLRERLAQLKQQLKEQDNYLQSRTDRLVEPDKMADLLKKVLENNGSLQLVELKTLPVSPLIETPKGVAADTTGSQTGSQRQIFKHGVQITVRGGYLDMIRYVTALEKLPEQMFWGEASLSVEKYPDSLFTLTLYTLSLDKTWLAM